MGVVAGEAGVIYAAIGGRYIREAKVSAASVRARLPGYRIVLFCDSAPANAGPFDEIRVITPRTAAPHLDKLLAMKESPFERTLFLDVDTFLCDSPDGLFDLLDRFDIAMAHDPRYGEPYPEGTGVPPSFPEFNQGVVLFRRSVEMAAALQSALDWAHQSGRWDDQVALRIALYHSDLRIAPLPPEYNCRFGSFGYLSRPAIILHGRIPTRVNRTENLRRAARLINREAIPRVLVGGRIYALRRWHLRQFDHFLVRRTATLFHPVAEIIRRGLRGLRRAIFSRKEE